MHSIRSFNFQKITKLQNVNKENESEISELREKVINNNLNSNTDERTPLKLNRSHANLTLSTPKTPKTPKTPLFGKENQSPSSVMTKTVSMSPSIIRIRQ